MTDFDQTAEHLESFDTLDGELENGMPIRVKEIPSGKIKEFEQRAKDNPEDEMEILQEFVDDVLVKPELQAQNISPRKLRTLFDGIVKTLAEEEDVEQAKEEMPLSGNRT